MAFRLSRPATFRQTVVFISGQPSNNGSNENPGSVTRRLLPCLLAVASYLFPYPASAEGRCPPGMFETGSQDYIACAPIPNYDHGGDGGGDGGSYDSGSYSQGPSGPQYAKSAMATAVHVDTSAVWGTAGHRTVEAAKSRVMDACTAAMGEGCIYAENWTGDAVIAAAIDGSGGAWPRGAATKAEAEKEALAACEKEAGSWGCKISSSFANVLIPAAADRSSDYSRDYFPQGPVKRRFWVLHAWPETTPAAAWQRKSWIISGRQNYAAAEKELLARCQADTGVSCKLVAGAANGSLANYVNKRGQGNWINVSGAATPAARVDQFCLPDEKPCRILALYDAATPRLQVVPDPEPTRGYVSVAIPTKIGWKRLAIVTGRPSAAAANTDAVVLCESQSKVPCELFLDNPDNRHSMFLGVYSLPDNNLHIVFGSSAEHVKKRAAEFSVKNNAIYTNRAMVDLHPRGEVTPIYED